MSARNWEGTTSLARQLGPEWQKPGQPRGDGAGLGRAQRRELADPGTGERVWAGGGEKVDLLYLPRRSPDPQQESGRGVT